MKKITEIEGLRGYLAIWVLIDHVLGVCGYSLDKLSGFIKVIRAGGYAVDVFIIISGFVIFYLLDIKKQSYYNFIKGRFFRIFPLFIILFFLTIPLTYLLKLNIDKFLLIYPSSQFVNHILIINASIEYFWQNILLHITMLHGVIPQSIVPYAPTAFLIPGWSISLEWQFYLIAPLVFRVITSYKKYAVLILSFVIILIFYYSNLFPDIQFGAFLPLHIEYFYIGGMSYFLYKKADSTFNGDSFFVFSIVITLIIFKFSNSLDILPFCIWISFFSLVINLKSASEKNTLCIKTASIFNNVITQYIGKISYSIYLSHYPIIILTQWVVLNYLPLISRKTHLTLLTSLTFLLTLFVSHFLFKYIEKPFIKIGQKTNLN